MQVNMSAIISKQQIWTSHHRRCRVSQNRSLKNKFQIFTCKVAKIHFSIGILSERETNATLKHRLAGTEGGELNGAIFFPKENY